VSTGVSEVAGDDPKSAHADPGGNDGHARASSRVLWLSTASVVLTVALSPLLPSVDFPQHVASAEQLRRLWFSPETAAPGMALNAATHNAGVQLFAALVGSLPFVGVHAAARLFFALALGLQVVGLRSLCRATGLPESRALALLPVLLGFSMVWGLANFAMGTGLSLLCLGIFVQQLDKVTVRFWWLPLLSLLVSLTHVMTMLLLAIFALGLGLERLLRAPTDQRFRLRMTLRTAALGSLLLPGCFYDLWVLSRHLGIDAASYSTAEALSTLTPSVPRKLLLLGTFGSGLYAPFTDIALTWLLLVALGVAFGKAIRARQALGLVSVLGLALALYLAIPSVFLNTHLIYQRLVIWIVVGLALAVPQSAPRLLTFRTRRGVRTMTLERLLRGLAIGVAILAPLQFGLLALETHGLRTVLADVPRGSRVTGVMEAPRSFVMRTPTLEHLHALAVSHGAEDATFSFARYMGGPVIYRPDHVPFYPTPSWEHDGRNYRWESPLARDFPWVLQRLEHDDETTEDVCQRLFGDHCDEARLVRREGAALLWDTRGLPRSSSEAPSKDK
jgi:hypothetical protein